MRVESARRKVVLGLVAFVVLGPWLPCRAATNRADVEAEFNKRRKAWGDFVVKNTWLSDLTGNEHYRAIIDLGLPVVPLLAKEVTEGKWPFGDAMAAITKKRFEEYEQPPGYVGGCKAQAELLAEWWPRAREHTRLKFERLYSEWKSLGSEGKTEEANKKLKAIRGLGVAAFPCLLEKIEAGDKALVPVFSYLTGGRVAIDASAAECLAWWQKNQQDWNLAFEDWNVAFPQSKSTYRWLMWPGIALVVAVSTLIFYLKARDKAIRPSQ
ncbi:MAG TPA: hypothetical protein VMW16_05445 [Sedimentisphaerales bacterium]|nr:hypothetical protein [Sedimentisphaerales bacterium]